MYEIVDTEARGERGVMFREEGPAIRAANEVPDTSEVWMVADDDNRTRVLLVWPEEDLGPGERRNPETGEVEYSAAWLDEEEK